MGNDYDFGKEKVHISSEVLTKTVNSYFTRNVHTHLTTNTTLDFLIILVAMAIILLSGLALVLEARYNRKHAGKQN